MSGMVFNIEKFAAHDGPGIRTVVFLKGCPLRCIWCHSPESQHPYREIQYRRELCVSCGQCITPCDKHCHQLVDGRHVFERQDCSGCGRCVAQCVIGSLSLVGTEMTALEVIDVVLQDKMFYDESGGGMTISGGEPLFQAEFTLELLQQAACHGISSCVETCGFGDYANLKSWLPYMDYFLFDYKAADPILHKKLTGVDNHLILSNLKKLNADGAKIILRCPLIPGVNDSQEHLLSIARLADRLENVREIHLEPYNPLAAGSYECLGIEAPLQLTDFPSDDIVELWRKTISSATEKTVIRP